MASFVLIKANSTAWVGLRLDLAPLGGRPKAKAGAFAYTRRPKAGAFAYTRRQRLEPSLTLGGKGWSLRLH